jgi:hypothetical protein
VPDLGRHHPFKDPAQHVRGDAALIPLDDSEVKPLEEPVECVAPELVTEVGPETTF